MIWLSEARRVLLLHAHPDDETLTTGALIAELRRREVEVAVLTATRGERGEVTAAAAQRLQQLGRPNDLPELVALRAAELAGALAALDATAAGFLGTPPARAATLPPRRYTDSGMRWISAGLAGPCPDAGTDALTQADWHEAAADVAACARHFRAELLISYDATGGYGHPDHVACHHLARLAARLVAIPCAEVIDAAAAPAGFEILRLERHLDQVRSALRHYTSQLSVAGDDVVHVGGQRAPITTDVGIRRTS